MVNVITLGFKRLLRLKDMLVSIYWQWLVFVIFPIIYPISKAHTLRQLKLAYVAVVITCLVGAFNARFLLAVIYNDLPLLLFIPSFRSDLGISGYFFTCILMAGYLADRVHKTQQDCN